VIEPKYSQAIKSHTEFLNYLGKHQNFWDLYNYFKSLYQTIGLYKTLNQYLPLLLEGVAASAFHALLMIGYGLMGNNDDSVLIGLTFMSFSFLSFGKLENYPQTQSVEPRDIIQLIHNDSQFEALDYNKETEFPNKLKSAIEDVKFVELLSFYNSIPLKNSHKGIDFYNKISQLVIQIFASSSDDFFLLHAVTGTHSFRYLLPYLGDESTQLQCVRYLWKALLAIYIVQGRIEVKTLKELNEDWDWEEIIALAIRSDDEHVLKFVYTCHDEYCHYKKFII